MAFDGIDFQPDDQQLDFQPDAPEAPAAPAVAPQASQADVRRTEPPMSPGQTQDERMRRWEQVSREFVNKRIGDTVPPGIDPVQWSKMNRVQRIEAWSGMQNPARTEEQAGIDELAAGGKPRYDTGIYQGAQALAGVGGFALGGPAGATIANSAVRAAALAENLDKAVSAGAITQDRADELFWKELRGGALWDALFNFGTPVVGQALGSLGRFLGAKGVQYVERALQRQKAVKGLAEKAGGAGTPGGQAVEELSKRMEPSGTIPTPGQVTGSASVPEIAARVASPRQFTNQEKQIVEAAKGMRNDLVNPPDQPTREVLGQTVLNTVDSTEKALKARLRPAFQAADELGVRVDMQPVVTKAQDALAKLRATNGSPQEISYLERLVQTLENEHPVSMSGAPMVPPQDALDIMSGFKGQLRGTPDWQPSTYFTKVIGDLTNATDLAYAQAAAKAGKGDVLKNLLAARDDYRGFMETAYDDAFKAALRRQPEDVGRLFWQGGATSEVKQFRRMLDIAQREGALGHGEAQQTMRNLTRGFLQEAVPDIQAAAKWSETLNANPLRRDTWNALTSSPGGAQLRAGMETLEKAAQMALRDSPELIGTIGMAAIPLRRMAGLGLGVSYVTGAVHLPMMVAGLSVDQLAKMMAVAYTHGDKGVANAVMRALRANGAGTAASAQVLKETLPEIKKYADKYRLDPFVYANGQQEGQQ